MLDAGGEPGDWTFIGDSNCLMSGYDERGIFMASFRLALDVLESDEAGHYEAELTVAASPG